MAGTEQCLLYDHSISKTHLQNGSWVIKLPQYRISQIRGKKKHCKDLTKISKKKCSKASRVFLILYSKSFVKWKRGEPWKTYTCIQYLGAISGLTEDLVFTDLRMGGWVGARELILSSFLLRAKCSYFTIYQDKRDRKKQGSLFVVLRNPRSESLVNESFLLI